MRREVKWSFAIVLLLLYCISFAQTTRYRNYKYDWGTAKPAKLEVHQQFANSDVVILQEKNSIRIDEQNNFYIEKYMLAKCLTAKGVQQLSKIILPETFDPEYDYRSVPFTAKGAEHRPWYDNMDILYFAARVVKPGGPLTEADVTDKVKANMEFETNNYVNVYDYEFSISNIEPGDELEIRYKYFVPFRMYYFGNSGRYFFHGKFPKQDYELKITYDDNLRYFFFVHNNASPDDTIITNPKNPSIGLVWKRSDLFAVDNEPGAIMHKDLPYVSYYRHFGDYGIHKTGADPTKLSKILPYSWTYFSNKMLTFKDEGFETRITQTDKNTLGIKRLFESVTDSTDTSMAVRFGKVHSLIAHEFKYISNYEAYKQDAYVYESGEAAEKKILYEKDRYRVYMKLMDRTQRMYYMAFIPDKRLEDIDHENYFPFLAGNRVFCLPYENSFMYYFPKFSRFGYEVNELPFYLEDVNMVLVPQHIDRGYLREKKNGPQDERSSRSWRKYANNQTSIPGARFIISPNSDETQNMRNTNVAVNISLDSLKINFDARLALSGQFSTMTRGAYLYSFCDSSVNPKYGLHVYDLAKKPNVLQNELSSRSAEFPYKTNFKIRYSSTGIVRMNDDGTYSIDLSGWFHHITYDNFTSSGRQLSFYPDFKMQDIYKYRLKFDHPVSVLNSNDYDSSIDNEFGKYRLKITQVAPAEIEIESMFVVAADVVAATKTLQVEEIYSKIEKVNKSMLKIRIEK